MYILPNESWQAETCTRAFARHMHVAVHRQLSRNGMYYINVVPESS